MERYPAFMFALFFASIFFFAVLALRGVQVVSMLLLIGAVCGAIKFVVFQKKFTKKLDEDCNIRISMPNGIVGWSHTLVFMVSVVILGWFAMVMSPAIVPEFSDSASWPAQALIVFLQLLLVLFTSFAAELLLVGTLLPFSEGRNTQESH
ncbi:MAG: hypothetical protein HYT22_01735 [Candidatus Niyogibacteria bacterium]|nr:hypothetical protein [Candidatus Niyogibacteria bacterium]